MQQLVHQQSELLLQRERYEELNIMFVLSSLQLEHFKQCLQPNQYLNALSDMSS
jgi:hypothetical protein